LKKFEDRLIFSELPGASETPDLIFISKEKVLYAVIKLKYDSKDDDDNLEKKLTNLALTALKAIEEKDYWRPYEGQAKTLVKIGIGLIRLCRYLALTD
jgi:hypothetical protein